MVNDVASDVGVGVRFAAAGIEGIRGAALAVSALSIQPFGR